MSGADRPGQLPAEASWPSRALLDGIRSRLPGKDEADVALVLGSGLGAIAGELDEAIVFEASELEGYPESTVAGHHGRLHFGKLGGRWVWIVQGRVHVYEGYDPAFCTRYVRLLHSLGVRTLILTNAAGAVDARVGPGEILLAEDAANIFFRPLSNGPADSTGIWRRRSALSDPDLIDLAIEVGALEGIAFERGTLIGSTGPSYETAAEVTAWRRLGGTVASMSTVPEAIEARELGLRCLLFSLVTNYGTGISDISLTHEDVVEQAGAAGRRLGRLLKAIVPRLP